MSEMSSRYSSIGELGNSLKNVQIHPPPKSTSSTHNHIHNYNPVKNKLIQTKLPFSIPPTSNPIPAIASPQGDSTIPTEEPENDSIQYQHRFSSSYFNDSQWLGIRIQRKQKHTARIWGQNINGIKRTNNFLNFAECLEALTQYEIDHFSFSETNLNSKNSYVKDSIEAVTRNVLPSSRHIMSSTIGLSTHEPFQFGGTMSLSMGLLSSRFASMGQDKYGRYSWIQYFGKKHHLRIYNVYRPCKQTDNSSGNQTVWQQHRSALMDDGITLDPRKQILNSLAMHIREDVAKKRQVIVIGDFNENIFDAKLNDFFRSIDLQNAIALYIDSDIQARSYFRGKTIIDGIWSTIIAQDSIRSIGLAPFYFVLPSDHRAIYCDIDIKHLLDDNTQLISPAPYRRLISTSPKRVNAYCNFVTNQWFLHNISLKLDQIEDLFRNHGSVPNNISLLNKIDINIKREKMLQSRPRG